MLWLIRLVLVVVGILAVVVGIIYLVEPIHSLPSFFPGHALHGLTHHHIRGYIAIAVGAILLILAAITRRSRRRSAYRTQPRA
jgi:NADH:ubiquinone oxidoreductase subunit 5 (subunit L)/multisubunit Na+/H+ antiporter MnhA subunit